MQTRSNSEAPRASLRVRMLTRAVLSVVLLAMLPASALADQLKLADGSTMQVDEAWEDAQGVWYRRAGVTHWVERSRVKQVIKAGHEGDAARDEAARAKAKATSAGSSSKSKGRKGRARFVEPEPEPILYEETRANAGEPAAKSDETKAAEEQPVWIYLVGGAKMEVDEASEDARGVWYKRGNISTFIERARVERVERERVEAADVADVKKGKRERRWSTGNSRLDSIIRQSGSRHGVDPYLIFCVMEQESHFNTRAVSPVGARGLMQLMPGTAARFGVRNPHDAAQNVSGGARYLKELLGRFRGRVDLVLAGYNAGEGNVMRFGYRVPPFRETRNYVRRVGSRYSKGE
ncbi:MAG TPA: lytic transglycosylase domain-containing protein [Pyrinomonadaceae bacterium]|nr:lytic transglycosylase domain-containing protein [Pyrinomonadaceae bacterium]